MKDYSELLEVFRQASLHVSKQHLQRYVGEFEFRYNNRESLCVNDERRATELLKENQVKRLTYWRIDEASA